MHATERMFNIQPMAVVQQVVGFGKCVKDKPHQIKQRFLCLLNPGAGQTKKGPDMKSALPGSLAFLFFDPISRGGFPPLNRAFLSSYKTIVRQVHTALADMKASVRK